jgi:hypothetical protein
VILKHPRQKIASILFIFLSIGTLLAEGTLRFIHGDSVNTALLNIVMLAEAYPQNREQKFIDDVMNITAEVLNNPPYKHYESFFNVWSIFVPSADSGADHPDENIEKNTYFDATFSITTPQLVTFSNKMAAYDLLAEHVPDYDIVSIIVNDSRYGGSGGAISVVTACGSSTDLFLHETGHSFTLLGDEYESSYTLKPAEKYNVTAKTKREEIPWTSWILPETPVPTPETTNYQDVVGLFEGAMYQPKDWYRPKYGCKMRALSMPFCEVCTEAHIVQFYSRISPIKESFPQMLVVNYPEDTTTFSVATYDLDPNTITVTWFLDTEEVHTGGTLSLDKFSLESGEYIVKAVARDTTLLARNPLAKAVMSDSVFWNVKFGVTDIKRNRSLFMKAEISVNLRRSMITFHGIPENTRPLQLSVYSLQGKCIVNRKTFKPLHPNVEVSFAETKLSTGLYIISVKELTSASRRFFRVFAK